MENTEKKKIQVLVDSGVARDTEKVLNKLGIHPTTAINALYNRIAATGSLPFNLELTEDEKIDLHLKEAISKLPVKNVSTRQELEDFFNEDY